jgi:transcriptional antiterminator NusG
MSEEKDLMKWYVVRSVSGQENKIKDYIESEIAHHNLGDYLTQILVPTEKVVQIRDGKKSQGTCLFSWLYYGTSPIRR